MLYLTLSERLRKRGENLAAGDVMVIPKLRQATPGFKSRGITRDLRKGLLRSLSQILKLRM